jgi:hypothetical protein
MPMTRRALLATALLLALAACSGGRETEPARTATEQLLFSVAAERAADQLALNIPAETKVFVDPAYVEGTDSKYLLSTIRDRVLRHGAALVDNKAQADLVIEPRVGAISIDRDRTTLGMDEFDVPIPMAGEVHVPSIALYKRDIQQGVIKIAATTYDSKSGRLIQSLDPVYGFSHKTQWGALLIFSWETNDLMPQGPTDEWVGD